MKPIKIREASVIVCWLNVSMCTGVCLRIDEGKKDRKNERRTEVQLERALDA